MLINKTTNDPIPPSNKGDFPLAYLLERFALNNVVMGSDLADTCICAIYISPVYLPWSYIQVVTRTETS